MAHITLYWAVHFTCTSAVKKYFMKNSEPSRSSVDHHTQRNDDNFSEATGRSISLKILEME